MKNIIKLTILLTSLFSFASNSNEYISTIKLKSKPNVVNSINNEKDPVLEKYQYVDQFDTSLSGAGLFSNNNRTYKCPSSSSCVCTSGGCPASKPTFSVYKTDSIVEARIKFKTGGYNYANGFMIKTRLSPTSFANLAHWYNNTKLLYIYNDSGKISNQISVGGGSSTDMEFRFNMKTNQITFLVNDVVKYAGTSRTLSVDNIFFTGFEGSYSVSTLTLTEILEKTGEL